MNEDETRGKRGRKRGIKYVCKKSQKKAKRTCTTFYARPTTRRRRQKTGDGDEMFLGWEVSRLAELAQHSVYSVERRVNLLPNLGRQGKVSVNRTTRAEPEEAIRRRGQFMSARYVRARRLRRIMERSKGRNIPWRQSAQSCPRRKSAARLWA